MAPSGAEKKHLAFYFNTPFPMFLVRDHFSSKYAPRIKAASCCECTQVTISLACPASSSKEGFGQTIAMVKLTVLFCSSGSTNCTQSMNIIKFEIIIYSKSRNEDSKNKQQLVNHSYCPCVSYLRPKLDNTRAT